MTRRTFLKSLTVASIAIASGMEILLPRKRDLPFDPIRYKGDFYWLHLETRYCDNGVFFRHVDQDGNQLGQEFQVPNDALSKPIPYDLFRSYNPSL